MKLTNPGNKGGVGLIDFAPVVDGVVLTESPYSALKNKNVHKIPILFGTNRDEGTEFVSERHVPDEAGYKAWALSKFGDDLAPKVMAMYPSSNYNNSWQAAVQAFGDEAMSCPARETARLMSEAGIDAYLYFLTHELKLISLFDKKLGVFHGTDLVYVPLENIKMKLVCRFACHVCRVGIRIKLDQIVVILAQRDIYNQIQLNNLVRK